MTNEIKYQRDAMVQEAIANDPRIEKAKKFIMKLCIVFLAARLIFLIVETAFVLSRGLPVSSCVLNYVLLAVGLLFALGLYKQGTKALAYLAIAGGVLTIVNLLKGNFISNLQIGDVFYNIYAITLVVAMLIQIASMLLMLLNDSCKKYFSEMERINKTIMEQNNRGIIK